MAKMSEMCKETMVREFGFTNPELIAIENFMNSHAGMTAKEILDSLIKDKKLNGKQKILISYVVGTSVEAEKRKKKIDCLDDIDIVSGVPNFGG